MKSPFSRAGVAVPSILAFVFVASTPTLHAQTVANHDAQLVHCATPPCISDASVIVSPSSDQTPQPTQVLLRFQLIEATNYAAPRDPAIAEVDSVLRDLFRYNGYKLLSQAVISTPVPPQRSVGTGSSTNHSTQLLSGLSGRTCEIVVQVTHQWGPAPGSETMTAHVTLADVSPPDTLGVGVARGSRGGRTLLSTAVTIAPGRTVVIGSTQPAGPGSALILAVRPTLR